MKTDRFDASEFRSKIPPVEDGIERPLWSVMIPTYHCARFLEQALTSVLEQDPGDGEMQIEVVDDHSTNDDPEKVVRRIGKGRVTFFRQEKNVGHIANFTTCLSRSKGKLVHLLHGDDRVLNGFYKKMEIAFSEDSEVGAAFCRQIFIDENGNETYIADLEQEKSGILKDALRRMAEDQIVLTPSIVVRRDAYEKLGGFDRRLVCAEDWEMWVRIAANYKIGYESEPLAMYRMHDESNTGRHVETGDDRRYAGEAIRIFSEYLPENIRSDVTSRARETVAFSGLRKAYSLWLIGNYRAARQQFKTALELRCSIRVFSLAARLALKAFARSLRLR